MQISRNKAKSKKMIPHIIKKNNANILEMTKSIETITENNEGQK